MRFSTTLAGSTALALVMTAQSAWADLSAEDVWRNWQSYFQSFGYETTATEARSGETLTLSDIVMRTNLGEGEVQAEMQLGNMQFVENADGTVSVVLPQEMPLRVVSHVDGMEPVEIDLTYRHTGLDMVASGTAENMLYTYSADELTVDLTEIKTEDDVDMTVKVVMAALAGTTRLAEDGDTAMYSQDVTMERMNYDIAFQETGTENQGQINGLLETVKGTSEAKLPEAMNPADMSALFAGGMALNAVIDYARGESSFEIKDSIDGNFDATTASQGGRFELGMTPEGLLYDLSARNLELEALAEAMPLGVSTQMGEAGFKLSMPVTSSDEEQDFAFGLNLTQLTVNEGIWNMFDPGAALPRDPADLKLDLSGKAKLFQGLLDEQGIQEAAIRGEPFGEFNALTINTLLLSIAGAKLTGAGDFTFDNSVDFNGMPKPEGAVDLQLEGGNGLLDNLVSLGLLPEEQAMGARMMMGLFAVPGEGDDVLNSKIEINEAGHILANGQRIQ